MSTAGAHRYDRITYIPVGVDRWATNTPTLFYSLDFRSDGSDLSPRLRWPFEFDDDSTYIRMQTLNNVLVLIHPPLDHGYHRTSQSQRSTGLAR